MDQRPYERKMSARFRTFDHDRDGVITAADFEAMALSILTEFGVLLDSSKGVALLDGARHYWEGLSGRLDTDLDAQVTEEEFIEASKTELLGNPDGFTEIIRPWAEAVIAIADTDGDGMVDLNEWGRMLRTMGGNDVAVRRRLQALDANQDGQVSLDEVLATARDFYTTDQPMADFELARA